MDVILPDGTVITNVPEGTTKAQLIAKLKAGGYDVSGMEALHGAALAEQQQGQALLDRRATQTQHGPALVEQQQAQELAQRNAPRLDIPQKQPVKQASMDPRNLPLEDMAHGASRGMAPYAAGAALGSLGGPGGAAAGAGAVGLSQFIGDPTINAINHFFGTNIATPTEALNQLMDAAGMPRPQTQAGRLTESTAAAASGGLGGVGVGRMLEAGSDIRTTTNAVGKALADAPLTQVAGGAGAGLASQQAAEAGAPPLVQVGAGLLGGLGVGIGANVAAAKPSIKPTASAVELPPASLSYEDVADLVRTASRGGMGSQEATETLARAAPLNKDAAAAAERLGIDVPPDVLLDHRQLKEAIGLTRSMPGSLASAAWADAVERSATQADEAMALIDGSPDLSEVSDSVLKSMNDTQRALQAQSDDMYKAINARIAGSAEEAPPPRSMPPGGGIQRIGQERNLATTQAQDGRSYEVTAQVFKDRDAAVMSPSWPTNDLEDLTSAIKHRQAGIRAEDRGMSLANDAPTSPKWSEQNPEQWAQVQEDVATKFLGFVNSTPDKAHVLALIDEVDPLALGARIERDLSPSKQMMISPGKGELAVVDKKWLQTKPEQFQRWEQYFPTYNQKLRAQWAAEDAMHSVSPSPRTPPAKQGMGSSEAATKPPPVVDLVNSRKLMDSVVRDLGGDTSKLTSLEKQLMEMSAPGRKTPTTYAALMRMKSDVGQALEKASGPYKDVNSGILKRLYGALAEDQLANVERIGGKQLRDDMRLANQLTAKRKALEDRIVSLFGDERNGSIAQKLVSAVRSGAKGDITGFNRIVHQLPADLRKRAVATAIAAASRETKTNGFGFAKYVDLYQGLRRNSEVYKTVVQTLGPESEKFLNDLYKISKRITEARANVKTTGQANQALVQGIMAEGLVEKVMKSTPGRMATIGGATAVAGGTGGAVAGASAAMLTNALSRANKKALNAAGDLFASPEWQQMVAKIAAEDRVDKRLFNIAKTSKAFLRWTKEAGITDPEAWLRNALAASIGTGIAQQSQPELEAAQ